MVSLKFFRFLSGSIGEAAYSTAVRSQRAKIWIGNVIVKQNRDEGSIANFDAKQV